MGESYSDLTAVEYLMEYGYVPTDSENPFSVGAYVTGNKESGIRNYGMNRSPLNYSGVQGYDGIGRGSPHDDGEIWSAVNYDIRQALIAKYNANLGTVPVQFTGTESVTARGNGSTTVGSILLNQADYTGDLTVSSPAAVATKVVP